MSRPASWIFGVALALVAVGVRFALPALGLARLEKRALPGFSLALPHGKVAREERDYARGTFLVAADDSDAVVGAVWSPSDGEATSPQELEATAQVLAGGIGSLPKGKAEPIDVAGPDGKPLGSIRLGDRTWVTMAMCGARQIALVTIAAHGSERLHRRVVRSFGCAPDDAQEGALRNEGSALVLDLPGWRAAGRTPDRVQITDGRAALILQNVPSNIDTPELRAALGPLMQAEGVTVTLAPPREGRVDFTMKMGADTTSGWARVIHCGARSEAIMAIAENGAAADALFGRVGNARCRRPGEPAQAWPSAQP